MSFLYNSRLINQYNADDTIFAFYPIYMRRKGGGKLEKIVFCFLNIVVLLHKMKSRKFVVRFWLHWRPHTGWISISLEGFTKSLFTSWYFTLYLTGGIWISFLGVFKFHWRDSDIYPGGVWFHWRDSNILTGGLTFHWRDSDPSWGFINFQEGYLNPCSGILTPRKDIWIPPVEFKTTRKIQGVPRNMTVARRLESRVWS